MGSNHRDHQNPIHCAIEDSSYDYNVVLALLNAGINVNVINNGYTPSWIRYRKEDIGI